MDGGIPAAGGGGLEPTVVDAANDAVVEASAGSPSQNRCIELLWPRKDLALVPRQMADGQWVLERSPGHRRLHPLVNIQRYPARWSGDASLVVSGDRIDALHTLARGLTHSIRLAYLDVPRIEVDDQSAAFKGDLVFAYSTWLSVLRAHLQAVLPLIRRDGVVLVHVGDTEEPYARLVADELFGRESRVATIVWQRAYAPRNMRGMKEFTATHDCVLVYALDKAALPAVGLRTAPSGFDNPDNDPRGSWKAEHKGAHSRREKSDFDTYVPPYHWRIANGRLPNGLWRLNPLTGVIWGAPEETGEFPLEIEVTDSVGETASAKLVLRVRGKGDPAQFPPVPWLFEEIETEGSLQITTAELPDAILKAEYSAICLAEGGTPFRAPPKRPGSGRYWEFADYTLLRAYQCDAVHLGRNGDAIPHPKKFLGGTGGREIKNQVTWWPGRAKSAAFAGYTQDATKHLKKLAKLDLIGRTVNTAKPEQLLARLNNIFTEPGDTVLEVFGEAADLAAVAVKLGRRFVYLSGTSNRQRELLKACAVSRLRAVVDGKDQGLEDQETEIRMHADAYIPYTGGGGFITCELGDWLFERPLREEIPRLSRSYTDFDELCSAVLTSQGFLPTMDSAGPHGHSLIGDAAAVVLQPDAYLDRDAAARIVSALKPQYDRVVIHYFRAAEDLDPSALAEGVICRRVPTEVTL